MTYENIKKNGTEILEHDLRNNGIYYGTESEYLVGNEWYTHRHVDNTFDYHGRENTTEYRGTKADLIKFINDALNQEYGLLEMFQDECWIDACLSALVKINKMTVINLLAKSFCCNKNALVMSDCGNVETLEEKMRNALLEAYREVAENNNKSISVCVEPNGNIYSFMDWAGGNLQPESVWNGTDKIIQTFDGNEFHGILEAFCEECFEYEVAYDYYMTDEQKDKFDALCTSEEIIAEYGEIDEYAKNTIFYEKFPDVLKELESDAVEADVDKYIEDELDEDIDAFLEYVDEHILAHDDVQEEQPLKATNMANYPYETIEEMKAAAAAYLLEKIEEMKAAAAAYLLEKNAEMKAYAAAYLLEKNAESLN